MSLFKDKVEVGILEAELGAQKALNRMPPLLKWLTIIVVLGIVPLYFVSKSVAKNIWSKKYQADILQAKPSFVNPLPVEVSDVTITTMGENVFAALVKITNPNLDLSVDAVPYSFKFFGKDNQLLYSSDPDLLFLLPNQSKYLTLPRFTTNEAIESAVVDIPKEILWQKRLSIPEVPLLTPNPTASYQFFPQAFVLDGDFTNKSAYSLKQVRLTFLLLGANGEIMGVSRRDESTIKPFEKRAYKQLWPNLLVDALYSVQVFAETNTLDPNNLSATALPSGSASDLSRPENRE